MSRMTGSWLSGPDSASDESSSTGYPGQRLGLPERGPGSIAFMGRRAFALFIDWVLALGVAGLVAPWIALEYSLLTLVVWALTGAIAVALFGFTPGQFVVGLRVIRVDGSPHVGPVRALIRGLSLCIVVPALFQDTDGRGMHDQASGTAVVLAR